MLVMLSTLIAIHNKLKLALPWTFKGVKWWMDVPFSLYLGWISIATIANVTVLFVNMGLVPPGLSPLYWTILMIIIGALLALLMIFRRNNVVYAFVAIWAFYGILSKRSAIGDAESNKLVIVCWVAIAVISISVIINVFSRKRSSNTSPAIL
jgi:hypothetical protein